MHALLILAGRSTRFWPLQEKSFFPVAGTCVLFEQVRRLHAAGIRRITLVTGEHNAALTTELLPSLPQVRQEDLSLGMRGALLSALPHVDDEPILLVSANDLIDVSAYRSLATMARGRKSGGVLLARQVSRYFPGGYLSVRGTRILGIVEKPAPGTEPSSLVNIVAHVHVSPSALLSALRATKTTGDDGYEVALDALMQQERYDAAPYDGAWHPVKYPWHLLDVLPALLPSKGKPSIHPTASVHRTAVIEGPVRIDKGARVYAHATITGPAYIGHDAVVANNALVRGSSVGARSVVGYSTEICRSILAEDVWTHMNYVGDSVIGPDVSLGGGTMTGNLRLDETDVHSMVQGTSISTNRVKCGVVIGSGCRIGVHTTFAPGVKVGQGTFIASAASISADIPDRSFVRPLPTDAVEIRPNRLTQNPSRAALHATLHAPSSHTRRKKTRS